MISVPTPLRDGAPDLSHIESAALALGALAGRACVILESTTYPGTTEELVAPLLETASGLTAGSDFRLGYSPERIDPGNRTHTLRTTQGGLWHRHRITARGAGLLRLDRRAHGAARGDA